MNNYDRRLEALEGAINPMGGPGVVRIVVFFTADREKGFPCPSDGCPKELQMKEEQSEGLLYIDGTACNLCNGIE